MPDQPNKPRQNKPKQRVAFVEKEAVKVGYVVGDKDPNGRGGLYLVADRPQPPFTWWTEKGASQLTEIPNE